VSAFTASVILEGRSIPSPTPVRLHAGPLKMLLDPASSFLRQITLGDELVLNGIYAAVRDHNWGTVAPAIRDLKIDQQPDSFAVEFVAECRHDPILFVWRGRIAGDAAGTIRYTFDGEAQSDFLRNRIGLCILHGANCAGRPCVVEHVDGRRTESAFPQFISPHQPFKQLRAISHRLAAAQTFVAYATKVCTDSALPAVRRSEIEVRFNGEVFEMEDQRNWTDASFKTYCTPLELPFPVKVRTGETFHQSVELRCRDLLEARQECRPGGKAAGQGDRNVALPTRVEFHPLPRLGLGMASHDLPLNEREVALLKRLQLDHLRCELTPLATSWEAHWKEAVRQATSLGCRLHVALHLDDRASAQLAAVAALTPAGLVDAWLIFRRDEKATSSPWTELARASLAHCGGLIAGGTDANFAELNRNRPQPGSVDAITWSINPQVHAFDNLSLFETLDAQWETVASARELFAGDLMISPVTLQPRFNPNATVEPPPVPPDVLPPEVDVRQMSLFGAAWTLGSIASLSRAPRLRSTTYYETTGWRGVMEWSERPRLPHKFVTRPNWVFPMYFAFALLAGFDEGQRVAGADPLKQVALLVRQRREPGTVRLLMASFDRDGAPVELPAGFTPVRRLVLDHESAVAAMREPSTLLTNGWSRVAAGTRLSISPFGLMALDGKLT